MCYTSRDRSLEEEARRLREGERQKSRAENERRPTEAGKDAGKPVVEKVKEVVGVK